MKKREKTRRQDWMEKLRVKKTINMQKHGEHRHNIKEDHKERFFKKRPSMQYTCKVSRQYYLILALLPHHVNGSGLQMRCRDDMFILACSQ